ncbi:TauD/TfdA family dioxygenase [Gluconacetobacter sacchari]|uniref:TauD/TfdA family dioxygenase n=1 Tax=Gluconacetobacter sacchari TaxID=92759 RepID=UPI0039B5BBFD
MSDLRSYDGNQHWMTAVTVDDGEVIVIWDDGHISRFHHGWLRENCPHPSSRHAKSRERLVRLLSMPEAIRPLEVAIDGSGALLVMWDEVCTADPTKHHQSRFHQGWLRRHCYTDAPSRSSSAKHTVTWRPESTVMADASWADLIGSDEAFYNWLCEFARTGWAVVADVPREDGACVRFAQRIGVVRASNFGHMFDVRSKADPNSNAYTSFYLPLHTDMPHYELPPGVQLLHSMVNSAEGGESLLVDGLAVADSLKREHPEAFRILTTETVPYRFQDDDSDYTARHPIIECDGIGTPKYINWSNSTSAPLDTDHTRMAAMRSAIRLFVKTVEDPHFLIQRKLVGGEMLVFDNRRMLHGRNAFDVTTGDRHLQGCYLDTSELHSRLDVLARRFGTESRYTRPLI